MRDIFKSQINMMTSTGLVNAIINVNNLSKQIYKGKTKLQMDKNKQSTTINNQVGSSS